MDISDKQKLAAQLRKTASYYRKEAVELEKQAAVKCAQVLTAANGLSQLQRILKGAER